MSALHWVLAVFDLVPLLMALWLVVWARVSGLGEVQVRLPPWLPAILGVRRGTVVAGLDEFVEYLSEHVGLGWVVGLFLGRVEDTLASLGLEAARLL